MKKVFLLLVVFLIVLSGCSKKEETVPEVIVEPIGYSEPIYLLTDPKSTISTVEDLADKKIGIQERFDSEEMAYAKQQLIDLGVTEDSFVEVGSYPSIPGAYANKEIDAWLALESRNEMIGDYLNGYDPSAQKIIAEYKMPIYEETVVDSAVAKDDLYTKPFAVMLMGLDWRVDPHENPNAARNDVNILLVVNPEKKHILTVSFPRDSLVYSMKGRYSDKLTHLSYFYGAEDVADSIGNLLDTEVPYYVAVSFSTFVDIITEMGGVWVDVPLDMHMDQDSYRNVAQPYDLSEGYTKLYGEWALALVRNRKYGVYGGDYGRIRNQALMVNSMISKIANHPFILDWMGISWFADVVSDNNFSTDQIKVLCELAKTFESGYTIDNYFVANNGGQTESGTFVGYIPNYAVAIAKGKIDLVMKGEIDEDDYYYDDILTGYVTGGSGSNAVGYIGDEYDLAPIFGIKRGGSEVQTTSNSTVTSAENSAS